MNLLDLLVVGVVVLAALGGVCTGLLRTGLAWLGVAPGQLLAVRLTPWVLDRVEGSIGENHPLAYPLGVSAGLLVVGGLVGYFAGGMLGRLLHLALPGPLRRADRVAGCVVAAAAAGAVVWLLAPTMAVTPGWFAGEAADSAIVAFVIEELPPPPDVYRRAISWLRSEVA